jgi:hypothetical protein
MAGFFGTLPDWLVATFTGASAFLIWRSTRQRRPVIEIFRWGSFEGSEQISVIVRNLSADHAAIVRSIRLLPNGGKWTLEPVDNPPMDSRVEPKSQDKWLYRLGGQEPVTSTSTPTIESVILVNRRTHTIRTKL